MDKAETLDLLQRMGAYKTENGSPVIEPMRLVEDPIVTNKFCVDAFQQLPPNSKVGMIIAPEENGTYFGYSAATTAWAKFAAFSPYYNTLTAGSEIKKKDKVVICFDTLESDAQFEQIKKVVEAAGAKVFAVFCIANIGGVKLGKTPIVSLVDVASAKVNR